jgi:protein-tyrosine phosphatase
MAEYLLKDSLRKVLDASETTSWVVESAGISANDGREIHPFTAELLTERNIDSSDFRSRRLTHEIARNASLILTATRDHRSQVAQLLPASLRRLFTLKQFAYLLSGSSALDTSAAVGTGHALLATAIAARAHLVGRGFEDDMKDPIGKPLNRFRQCAEDSERAISAMTGLLRP